MKQISFSSFEESWEFWWNASAVISNYSNKRLEIRCIETFSHKRAKWDSMFVSIFVFIFHGDFLGNLNLFLNASSNIYVSFTRKMLQRSTLQWINGKSERRYPSQKEIVDPIQISKCCLFLKTIQKDARRHKTTTKLERFWKRCILMIMNICFSPSVGSRVKSLRFCLHYETNFSCCRKTIRQKANRENIFHEF